ncbi:uncharacterized protein LOC128505561 [Clarias gariepinus]|uniref:uncharacterized protein LOC128505561 n=1 Tax=Clarias gariepinus TaxID=13013 RepID=UPI00234DAF08|nr:uncharacterized protein LOC128505561 [Clarias gariepinus]
MDIPAWHLATNPLAAVGVQSGYVYSRDPEEEDQLPFSSLKEEFRVFHIREALVYQGSGDSRPQQPQALQHLNEAGFCDPDNGKGRLEVICHSPCFHPGKSAQPRESWKGLVRPFQKSRAITSKLRRSCLSMRIHAATLPDVTAYQPVPKCQSNAPRTQPAQVSFTPAPGYHEAWKLQQRKTRAKPRARTSPPPPPPVFEISTRNRFAPLRETAHDALVIGDSIVRHMRATTAKGKAYTRCLPGARVLDVAAQVPAALRKNIRAVVLHAGTNDIRLRQTEILKKDFRSLVEKVRSTSPTTKIVVSGPLPTFQRGIERLYRTDGLHPSRAGAAVLSDNISRTLRTI